MKPSAPPDPLALRAEPVERLTISLPQSALLALYHYCLRSDADASKIPVAAARIVAAFLDRDVDFKRWRQAQGDALPASIPRRSGRGDRRA